jgi:nitroreductase
MTATSTTTSTSHSVPSRPTNGLLELPRRRTEADVDPMFPGRWSPRAFSPEPVDRAMLRSLFEAARWAPSSANEQPWLFVYAVSPEDRARFSEGLLEMNRAWASHAPVLVYLLTRRRVAQGAWAGQPNPMASFDAGAAWMSFALQAHLRGLSAHAMGGIDRAKVASLLGVPTEEYEIIVAIAVGYRGDPAVLPEPMATRERPSERRPLGEVAVEGRFPSIINGPARND